MKKWVLSLALAMGLSAPACAWDLWDTFKEQSVTASGRVIDHSDKRKITTSEGESYGMFFALVANDRAAFESMLKWTEDNLSGGDITKRLPSWLWGSEVETRGPWKILDTNNAMDSDMWIAYCLLEAARLWDRPDYHAKALAMMELIKKEVRTVPNLGDVLLPGRYGFETDTYVKLNPSYYPLFILRRFALEDSYWNSVFTGSLRMLLRSAPSGYSPDWVSFDKITGKPIAVPATSDEALGSYNAIRVYLWAGITNHNDISYDRLKAHFEPMIQTTLERRYVPEEVNVYTLEMSNWGPAGFAACLLPLLGSDKTAGLIRKQLTSEPLQQENYYRNVLTLFALGFDQRRYAFDVDGRVYFPAKPVEIPNSTHVIKATGTSPEPALETPPARYEPAVPIDTIVETVVETVAEPTTDVASDAPVAADADKKE